MSKPVSIPITVLTGFLGSGKTTYLNQLMASPHLSDTAVLINEFGEVGLDHLLVETVEEEVLLLESGCVCCSVKDNFIETLLELYFKKERGMMPPFSRVILETTGIADPSSIQQLILSDPELLEHFHYHRTITVVDCMYGSGNLDQFPEAIRQVCLADHLILSKTDLVPELRWHPLRERLRSLNPNAPIFTSLQLSDGFLALFDQKIDRKVIPATEFSEKLNNGHHDRRFSSFCVRWQEAVEWRDFEAWLQGLLLVRGHSILRLKGLLRIAGEERPLIIQGVQHSFFAPTVMSKWPGAKVQTELVFITCDFNKRAAIKSFDQILEVSVY